MKVQGGPLGCGQRSGSPRCARARGRGVLVTLSSVPKVVVRSVGEVHADDRGYAVEEISSVVAEGSEPMSDTGVKISLLTVPGLARPAIAQAQGRVKRCPLVVQVVAAAFREAADGLAWRIGPQIAR